MNTRRLLGIIAVVASLNAGLTVGNALHHHGSPNVAAHWQQQYFQDCLPMSAAAIIGAATGHTPSELEIDSLAADYGYTPDGGTPITAAPSIYLHYGLVAALEIDVTTRQLEDTLRAGYLVQAIVNGETLWHAAWDSGQVPGTDPDHAVDVASIDIAHSLVHVVDTGTQADEVVPLSVFEQAWSASSRIIVVVNPKGI